jgi:hypothetical protein
MDQTEEIRKIIETSQEGNWIPLTIVSGIFGIVILLLLYIWNQMLKNNAQRHKANESIIEKLADNDEAQGRLLDKYGVKIDRLEVDVQKHETDIKEIIRK